MDKLFKQLKCNGIGCHVGPVYAGTFGYGDDVALVALSLYSLKCMIATYEEFAKKHKITFNNNIIIIVFYFRQRSISIKKYICIIKYRLKV